MTAARRRAASGARGGGNALLRAALRTAAAVYGVGQALHRIPFDRGWRTPARAAVPVVSVGNLSTGGTGKTPFVALLARAARAAGRNPAILTRGYRRGGGVGESDEVALLRRLVPEVPVIVDPDRVRGAARGREVGAGMLILDDGFQHRRLHRDRDVVLLDAVDPFAGGHLLPRGLLREPAAALARAHAAVLTRADRADAAQRAIAVAAIARVAPGLPVLFECHCPTRLVDAGGAEGPPLAALRGTRVAAFSGIADPEALAQTLAGLGAELALALDYGDHHEFAADELDRLAREVDASGAALVVTTEKDLVRLPHFAPKAPLLALRIEARLESAADHDALEALLGFPV